MRRNDCITEVHHAVTAPMIAEEPHPDWRQAHENDLIPASLWGLYQQADYFSYGRTPSYLADPERLLFPYFERLAEGLREALLNAKRHADDVDTLTRLIYTPAKEAKKEPWDPDAAKKQRDSFKALVIELVSALDLLAELTALHLSGEVPGLALGRASFQKVQQFLANPFPSTAGVISPARHYTMELYDCLRPLIVSSTPEEQWLDLLFLYRNKLAHLGSRNLPQLGLHDEEPNFFFFLCKTWPFDFKQHTHFVGDHAGDGDQSFEEYLEATFLDTDIIEYSHDLYRRIVSVIDESCKILVKAYREFKDLPLNEEARSQLVRNSRTFPFERFSYR